eukprot:scaffold9274_cov103-Isochrysis_galbana.AAC.7
MPTRSALPPRPSPARPSPSPLLAPDSKSSRSSRRCRSTQRACTDAAWLSWPAASPRRDVASSAAQPNGAQPAASGPSRAVHAAARQSLVGRIWGAHHIAVGVPRGAAQAPLIALRGARHGATLA